MLCLRAELRPQAEAALIRSVEIAGPADQSAGDLLVRWGGGCAGVAPVSGSGIRHWLDWFHVSMRLTVMGQLAKGLANEPTAVPERATPAGLPDEAPEETVDAGDLGKQLE